MTDFSTMLAFLSKSQSRKPSELPVEPVIYDDSLQRTKATNSPSCENTELQTSQGELWKAESLLEEKPADPTSPEPVFRHQSTPPTLSHSTASREVFAQEEVSNEPLLPKKSPQQVILHSTFQNNKVCCGYSHCLDSI